MWKEQSISIRQELTVLERAQDTKKLQCILTYYNAERFEGR